MSGLEIRPAHDDDQPAVLRLAAASLGWLTDDTHAAFFDWKHGANPFGASPMWVAVDGDRVVAFRTFLRWEFEAPGGRHRRAVRAVDTATHPEYQRQGLFSRLTRHGVERLLEEGVDFVFNTPNDRSRAGYLKMGWEVVGRLPVSVRLRSPLALPRLLTSKRAAEKWSVRTSAGLAATEALSDGEGVAELLASQPTPTELRTRRSPEFLRWRYGFDALAYRALLGGDDVRDGVALFRLRRRGRAVAAVLCDVLTPGDDAERARALVGHVARETRADYVMRLPSTARAARGFVPLRRWGPVLTWRGLCDPSRPPLEG